jgi:beta-lactamase class A
MSRLSYLEEYIYEEARKLEGKIGIAIKDLKTGEQVLYNSDLVFPTASVFKIPVLVELYKQVNQDKFRLDDTVRTTQYSKIDGSGVIKELHTGLELTILDLATLMIIQSDNTATDLILELVGMDSINITLKEIGLEKTRVSMSTRDLIFDVIGLSSMQPEERLLHVSKKGFIEHGLDPNAKSLGDVENDVSTPFEMMVLLEKIYKNEILNQKSCEAMLDILKRCQYYNAIPLYLPERKVVVAHKTGNLTGIRNDVGIVYPTDKNTPFIVSAFTRGLKRGVDGDMAIARISEQAYNTLIKIDN